MPINYGDGNRYGYARGLYRPRNKITHIVRRTDGQFSCTLNIHNAADTMIK